MADPLRKVQSGDPLVITHEAYNAFVDAANAFQQSLHAGGQPAMPRGVDRGMVLVKNNSGAAVGRFGILGVDGVVIDPDVNLPAFKQRIVLSGVTPADSTHDAKFVIVQEPLEDGVVGLARAAGTSLVQLNIDDTIDVTDQADVVAATTHLENQSGGSAAVVWRAGGTGLQWAVVRLVGRSGHPCANTIRWDGRKGAGDFHQYLACAQEYFVVDATLDSRLYGAYLVWEIYAGDPLDVVPVVFVPTLEGGTAEDVFDELRARQYMVWIDGGVAKWCYRDGDDNLHAVAMAVIHP